MRRIIIGGVASFPLRILSWCSIGHSHLWLETLVWESCIFDIFIYRFSLLTIVDNWNILFWLTICWVSFSILTARALTMVAKVEIHVHINVDWVKIVAIVLVHTAVRRPYTPLIFSLSSIPVFLSLSIDAHVLILSSSRLPGLCAISVAILGATASTFVTQESILWLNGSSCCRWEVSVVVFVSRRDLSATYRRWKVLIYCLAFTLTVCKESLLIFMSIRVNETNFIGLFNFGKCRLFLTPSCHFLATFNTKGASNLAAM